MVGLGPMLSGLRSRTSLHGLNPNASSAGLQVADLTTFQKAQYTAYMDPFNANLLQPGDTFKDVMRVLPGAFPNATKIGAQYPSGYACPNGVWGFLAIDYGNYLATSPLTPITPKQVSSIVTLSQSHNVLISGNTAGFNLIFDCFLTVAANNTTNRVIEIDWQLHPSAGARSYILGLTSHGTWTDPSSQVWSIYTDPATSAPVVMYVLPAVGQDKLSGTIDVKNLMTWMVGASLITGAEYYNGHALGVEPVQGNGQAIINTLSVNYA